MSASPEARLIAAPADAAQGPTAQADAAPWARSVLDSRSGDMPVGLYWGMPLIVLLLAISLGITLGLNSPWFREKTAPVIWAVLLAAAVWQATRQRRWDQEQHRRRMIALEALLTVSTCMSSAAQTEAQVLQQIPRAMRALLGMKISNVALLEEDGKIFHIVASDGIQPSPRGERWSIDDLPMTQRCLQTRYLEVVSDTKNAMDPLNSALAKKMNFRALMQIPIVYQGQVLGVIVLGDSKPRKFTDVDLRRAWMWGCQTAVMLANTRLYGRVSQALADQSRLLQHRDAIYAVNTAIQKPGTLEEILQRIVDLAPGPLHVDAVLVWLIAEDNPEELVVGAVSAPFAPGALGMRLAIAGSKIESVLATGKTLVVEDGPNEPGLNRNLFTQMAHGSIIFEPLLRSDGQPLGVLKLMRDKPGKFSADQLELSHMFSVRAATAIETAQLYQQTTRDADAKAMLLRELNHRVKNNLASIVSLLSINQPVLRENARQWLNRAIDRISAMAQMHELFSGGLRRVTVAELVEKTVRSLDVAKPAGVTVRTELAAGSARLHTERAVSLAMAVHELCFNGLVHGLAGGGTLTIRCERNNGELMVEVLDDAGAGTAAPAPIERPAEATQQTGIGLSLVRGLIGRELKGQFSLDPAPGGAVAKVRFPLLADELRDADV